MALKMLSRGKRPLLGHTHPVSRMNILHAAMLQVQLGAFLAKVKRFAVTIEDQT